MSYTSTTTTVFANGALVEPGTTGPRNGANGGGINSAIINVIKDLYPEDQVKTLASWLKLSLKTAKNRLLGERDFTTEELATLLSSQHGYRVLQAIMDEAAKRPDYRRPEWWHICSALMDAADIRKMQAIANRRIAKTIESAIDANKYLSAAIERAETLAVHDADHLSNHLDALRSMGGVPHRALAPAKRRK